MGKVLKSVKKLVRNFDMFNTSKLLRFEQQAQYQSLSGGLVSITLIIIFVAIFTSTFFVTFQKTSITSKTTQLQQIEPQNFDTQKTPFLFAVGITDIDLNHPTTKYFNIIFSNRTQYLNRTKIVNYVQLQPCRRQQWSNVGDFFADTFDRLELQKWLCLPANFQMNFQGKFSSDIFRYAKIGVSSCSIQPGQNRTCVNSSFMSNYISTNGAFSFNYYFINTVINPDSTDFFSYYLQDRNYFKFTQNMGANANIFISTFTIKTDESLLPTPDYSILTGGLVYEETQTFIFQPSSEYVQLYLRKSSLSLSIERNFLKIDETLSYIGGLFSTFITLLFFMSKFNQASFQMLLATYLFKYDRKSKINDHAFNMFTFLPALIYKVIRFIGIKPDCKMFQRIYTTRNEINRQIDVTFLIRRITFLEDCLKYIFQDYQWDCLHLLNRKTLEEVAKSRRQFRARNYLLAKIKNEKKSSQASEPQNDPTNIKLNSEIIKTHVKSTRQNNPRKVFTDSFNNNSNEEDLSSEGSYESELDEKEVTSLQDNSIFSLQMLSSKARQGDKRCRRIYQKMEKKLLNFVETSSEKADNSGEASFLGNEEKVQDPKQQDIIEQGEIPFQFESISQMEQFK